MSYKTLVKAGLAQADGAQVFDLTGWEQTRRHQLQIVPSATPTAGTLTVAVRTPGADAYSEIGSIDMTGSELVVDFDCYADSVQITPASFDAAKTYDAYLFGSDR